MKMTTGIPADKLKRVLETTDGFLVGRMHGLESDALLEYVAAGDDASGIRPKTLGHLCQTPGFYAKADPCGCFATTRPMDVLKQWCDIYLQSLRECDILATLGMLQYNSLVEDCYDEIHVWSCVQLHQWLPYLEGKRVLVISPFEKTIRRQYDTKDFSRIFKHFGTLQGMPQFTYPNFELLTINAPNTVKGNEPFPHNNWMESFEELLRQVDGLEFDIAITGCGAYGMPIAHYVKTTGRGGIQAGAYAQVMFGIKGQRWKSQGWWNEHWVYPSREETPPSFRSIEGGDYWGPVEEA